MLVVGLEPPTSYRQRRCSRRHAGPATTQKNPSARPCARPPRWIMSEAVYWTRHVQTEREEARRESGDRGTVRHWVAAGGWSSSVTARFGSAAHLGLMQMRFGVELRPILGNMMR